MDTINKKGVPLCKQENVRVWKLLEEELKKNAQLKEQNEQLQNDFEMLYRHGFEKFMETHLSTPLGHTVK